MLAAARSHLSGGSSLEPIWNLSADFYPSVRPLIQETWIVFQAPGCSSCPALATAGIWGMDQHRDCTCLALNLPSPQNQPTKKPCCVSDGVGAMISTIHSGNRCALVTLKSLCLFKMVLKHYIRKYRVNYGSSSSVLLNQGWFCPPREHLVISWEHFWLSSWAGSRHYWQQVEATSLELHLLNIVGCPGHHISIRNSITLSKMSVGLRWTNWSSVQ